MATIRKRNGTWQVQIRRRGQTVSKTFKQRTDAQRWANQTELEADRKGLSTDFSTLKRLTVGDILVRFRDTVAPQRRGHKNETIVLNAFLRNELARVRLSELAPDSFGAYRDARLQAVKPGTINRELGLIQHIFEVARTEWSIPIAINPVKAIRKPKADKARDRRLQPGEWEKLTTACAKCRNKLLSPLVRFAVETAMRRGEMLHIRWQDLRWAESTLHISVTKTGEPRTIPLSVEAKTVLVELAIAWSGEARIFPLTAESVKLAWKRLVNRAGLDNLTFHDLRHEAVTRFFERGLTIPEVALISGHKDPRMLFRYTHLRAEGVALKLR